MEANGSVIRGYEIPKLSTVLEAVKDAARKTATRERLEGAVLAAATSATVGFVVYVLHAAIQNRTLTGF